MDTPVTAQRTKVPGRTTRKSPSRYLTSASPGIGVGRSVRLSTATSVPCDLGAGLPVQVRFGKPKYNNVRAATKGKAASPARPPVCDLDCPARPLRGVIISPRGAIWTRELQSHDLPYLGLCFCDRPRLFGGGCRTGADRYSEWRLGFARDALSPG